MDIQALLPYAAVLLITNAFCFLLMGYDKQCARLQKRRVPERVLFASALCFGALGGILAMRLFRHKTRHRNFRIWFPLFFYAQLALIALMAVKRFL